MKFDDYRITDEIKQSLSKMGLRRPTDIQFKAIPSVMAGEDVLAIAQTGTGKTAAFAIPIIDRFQRKKRSTRSSGIRCLVMVPTRELALQNAKAFQTIGRGTKVKTMCVFGGVNQDDQIAQLKNGVDILVATPGRMFDLVSQGYIDIKSLEVLIVDEADHMLDHGFIDDINDLITYIPKKRQTLFFSATIDKSIKRLAYSLVNNPIRIQISPKDPVSKNVNHSVAFIEMDDKRFFLERLIRENPNSKILVFVRTQVRAERVMKALERVDVESKTIHGGKDQANRLEVLGEFREGTTQVLIATDVSARGIDIPNVEYVINYDMPDLPENYVHRVGRTGRGRSKGTAISFCGVEEAALLESIEQRIGKEVDRFEIHKKDYEETLYFTEDSSFGWQQLLKEDEKVKTNYQTKKKRKK